VFPVATSPVKRPLDGKRWDGSGEESAIMGKGATSMITYSSDRRGNIDHAQSSTDLTRIWDQQQKRKRY
jgi:hypothetical protein